MEVPSIRQEILDLLSTPLTWAVIEILSLVVFTVCIIDAYRNNDEKIRLYRVLELFGYVFYSGIFENVGVLLKIYDYSLDRLFMFGVVPLEILLLEAVIFYSAIRFAEKRKLPNYAIPFVVGVLCVLQDLTIDPVAVFDLYSVNGVMQGQWNWTLHYENNLFGIPFFNFTGWFMMMFYYSMLITIGRHYFVKSGYKHKVGITYTLGSMLCGILLICSPLTNFMLFLQPFVEIFNRTAEITMLSIVMIISVGIMIKNGKPTVKLYWKDEKIVWVIPLILHLMDIIYAFALQIEIAYVPVILFAVIHMGYIGIYLTNKPTSAASIENLVQKPVEPEITSE